MSSGDHLIIYLYSYFPAILLAGFFWWMDRFEREPFWLVALAFLWGAFGAGMSSAFWNTAFQAALDFYEKGNAANEVLTTVVVAPFIEELMKGAFLLAIFKLGHIDNLTDGILLGIVVGLGFAASENVFYAEEVFRSSGELAMWNNLWFREIHTTLLHSSATAVWGCMLAYTRFLRGFQKLFAVVNGFVLAIVTHGFWNFMAGFVDSFQSRFNIIEILMRLELFVIFGLLLTLFLYSVFRESKIIIAELCEESANGVIPESHVGFFASMVRRHKRYELPQKIPHQIYAKWGVQLAFRKHEYRLNPNKNVFQEINKLRSLLSSAQS